MLSSLKIGSVWASKFDLFRYLSWFYYRMYGSYIPVTYVNQIFGLKKWLYRSAAFTAAFTLRRHPALVVRNNDITILRYLASIFFSPIQSLISTRGFRNMGYFTGKGYWPFAQPPTWRARCCSSSARSPGTCPARLNPPRTAVRAGIASRVTKPRKPPHHF